MKLTVVLAAWFTLLAVHTPAQDMTIAGTLVDNACRLEGMTPEQLSKHDKGCLQMGVCAKSGYSIVTADGKAYTLDAKGNTLAAAAIKKTARKTDLKATVAGVVKGETIVATSVAIDQ